MPIFESINSVEENPAILGRRAYGVIEVDSGRLTAIHFRPFPKLISIVEAKWAATRLGKTQLQPNRCLLYFNQPLWHRNFLVLQYMVSTASTSWTSCAAALSVLDHIAKIKNSDALLCELTYRRLSDRLMQRYGWQRHLVGKKRRHWIKRFYGKYPDTFLYQQLVQQHPSIENPARFPVVGDVPFSQGIPNHGPISPR